MIQPKDLRIGNYINGSLLFDDKGEEVGQGIGMVVQVFPQGGVYWTDDINADVTTSGYNGGTVNDDIGFKINKEILVKLGFKLFGEWYIIKAMNQLSVNVCLMHKKVTIGCNEEYEIDNIQYVHQVQNLYYALTGQELKIKL